MLDPNECRDPELTSTVFIGNSALFACAAAGLFVSNSGFNRLRINARCLVSNSAGSHGYI